MTPQAPTTPDSVVVPLEPTRNMIDAGKAAGALIFDTRAVDIWTAMLAARPAATPGDTLPAIEFVEDRRIEYVPADRPVSARRVDDRFSLLSDLETGEVIGFRYSGPLNAATPGGEREAVARIIRTMVSGPHFTDPASIAAHKQDLLLAADAILAALSRPAPVAGFTVDDLAQEIRRVDGNHDLGAGALAEALMPFLSAPVAGEAVAWDHAVRYEGFDWRLASSFPPDMRKYILSGDMPKWESIPLYATPQPAAARGGEVFWRVRNGESERGLFYDLDVARENAGDGDTIEALVPDPALSAKGGS